LEKALAMVMAGGRGTRMDILCHRRAKPILPFAGNYHVIDFTLSNCFNSQVDKVAVLVDYQRSTMIEYLNQWNATNNGAGAVSILQPEMGSYCGTADAVYQNLGYVKKLGGEKVLILAGDHVYKMDYRKMLMFHDQANAEATVAVIRVPAEQACRFGTVAAGADSRITKFVEKSSNPQSSLASMGIYVFNSDFLCNCLTDDAREPNSPHDFGYAILPRIAQSNRIFAYEFQEYWQDIGTIEAYYEANLQLLKSNPGFTTSGDWPIISGSRGIATLPQNEWGKIVNSLVSPECEVEGYVENSILSPGVRVGRGAKVINSVIMAKTSIGENSIVDRCILDEEVEVGAFCYIGHRHDIARQSAGITMLGDNVSLPHHTVIECKSKINPGLRLSETDARLIPSGSVISAPLIA